MVTTYRTFILFTLFISINAFASGNRNFSPGFNCDASHLSHVENLVCQDDDLSKKDYLLNALYLQALEHEKDPQQLKSSQRDWISNIRNRCSTESCLIRVYEGREIFLGTLLLPTNHLNIPYEWHGHKESRTATKSSYEETLQFTKSFQHPFVKYTVISCEDVWRDHAGTVNTGYGGICWAEIEGYLDEYYICYNEAGFHYEPVSIRSEYLAIRHLLEHCYGG